MLVLTGVVEPLRRRLKRAAGHRFQMTNVATWEQALHAIARRPVEVAVLDPALEGRPRAQEVERLRLLFPSLPIVLYTRLTAVVAPILLRLGQSRLRQVVLAGHDDHPKRLGEVLVAEATHSVAAILTAALRELLARCPGELRWAIETMVREPASVHTVRQLAERARMDRRTCLRWFARANLPPPSVMLTVIRVLYAHRLLQDPGYTVDDVAAKLGYAQTRSFAQHAKDVFGMAPGDLRAALTPDAALLVVRERYFSARRSGDERVPVTSAAS